MGKRVRGNFSAQIFKTYTEIKTMNLIHKENKFLE
jgi:uncharacterized membrane protein YobD (UPF0266 family)